MNDFYIVLPSNSNPNTHKENTASKYIVSWESPVVLDDFDKWKVALTEIAFNHSTWSIRNGHGIRFEVAWQLFFSYQYIVIANALNGFSNLVGGIVGEADPIVDKVHFEKHRIVKFWAIMKFSIRFTSIKEANDMGFNELTKEAVWGEYQLEYPNPNTLEIEIVSLQAYILVGDSAVQGYKTGTAYIEYIRDDVRVKEHIFNSSHAFTNVAPFLKFIKPFVKQVVGDIHMGESNVMQIQPDKIEPLNFKKSVFEKMVKAEVIFLNGMHHTLGFKENKRISIDKDKLLPITADFRPQLFNGINHMYVYASVCAPIQVGNVRAPLLKTIWLNSSNKFALNEMKHIQYIKGMYIPVSSNNFNSIEINIRLDSGELIPFSHGAITSLVLHFKKDDV